MNNSEKPGRKLDYHEHDTPKEGTFPNISGVASANECTGLMYRTPVNDEELESYQELSSMEFPKGAQNGNKTVSHQLHKAPDTAQGAKEAVERAAEGMASSQEDTNAET